MSTKMETRPAPKVMIDHIRKLRTTRDLRDLTADQLYTLQDEFLETMPTSWAANCITALSSKPLLEERPKKAKMEPGFYIHKGEVYKVVWNQAGTRMYARQLDKKTWRFEYRHGAINLLNPDERLTVEEASAYGHLTGRCGCCGRLLTNEESIERGIGPICFEKYF